MVFFLETHDTSHRLVLPHCAIPGFCLRSPSTESPPLYIFLQDPRAFHKCHGDFLPHPPSILPPPSSLYCSSFFDVLHELGSSARVKGARELGLDTGYKPRVHSLDTSAGLAWLITPSFRLSYRRIFHSDSVITPPSLPFTFLSPHPHPP